MLDGLEVAEVMLSEIDLSDRIDAEYFWKDSLRTQKRLEKLNAKPFSKYGTFVASAFYPAATHLYESGDTPFVRCVDCINYPMISKEQDDNFEKIPIDFVNEQKGVNILYRGDLVITKVGTPCYASLVEEYDLVALSRTVLGVKKIKNINPYYLLAFLRGRYGFGQLLRARELTIQYQLTLDRVKKIKIYEPSNDFQKHIEILVKSAHEKLEESKKLYREAEELLLGELGLKDFEPSRDSVAVRSFSDSFGASGRLDAEYYQPKYDEIISKIKSYKGGFEPLNKACKLHDTNFAPSDTEIYKYIELSNIGSNGEIKDCMLEIGAELPTRARRKVKSGQLVVSSIEGSLQSIAMVGGEYDNALCSTGFYVISSKSMNSETLLVLLKNEAMQAVLKKGCSGTILTAIGKDEFLNIPLPLIDDKIQKTIAEKINKSFELRSESKNLLDLAKKAVEDAIEQGG